MFAVLNFVSPAGGYCERRKQKVYLRKSEPSVVRTAGGLPFFIVSVLMDKKGVDWESLLKRLGKCSVRVIAPYSVALPDSLHRYTPKRLLPVMVLNTAIELIKMSAVPAQGLSVTLTDSGALLCGRALSLLPLASTVRIVTRHPEKYSSCAFEAMEKHGASLIITDSFDASVHHGIVICTDNCLPSAVNAVCVISHSRCPRGCMSVNGSGVEIDEAYLKVLPEGIDLLDFAGALLELCGVGSLMTKSFLMLRSGGCERTYDEAAQLLAEAIVCGNT